jgi:SAM-dependent methyltransferase
MNPHILAEHAAGRLSPQVALARLLLTGEAPDPQGLAAAAEADPRLEALATLARENADQLEPLAALARAGFDPDGDDVPAATARLFDRLAEVAPEAAVAFYSLGSPAELDRATAELLAVIRAWMPPAGRRVLDWGCGIGRVAIPLAQEAASVLALDVSAGMVTQARARAGDTPNLRIEHADLAAVPDASIDLMLACDSLPFLARAGTPAVEAWLAEAARVLAPGGDLLVFNWSYRGDPARDRAEAEGARGFTPVRLAEQPFAIWDAAAYHLRRD